MIEPLDSRERVGEQRAQPQRREDVGLLRGPQPVEVERGDRIHRRDRERVVDQAVDPAELRQRLLDERARCASSVMSVGTTSARRPRARTTSPSSRAGARCGSRARDRRPASPPPRRVRGRARGRRRRARSPCPAATSWRQTRTCFRSCVDPGSAQLLIRRATPTCRASMRPAYSGGVTRWSSTTPSTRARRTARPTRSARREPRTVRCQRSIITPAWPRRLQPVGDPGVAARRPRSGRPRPGPHRLGAR